MYQDPTSKTSLPFACSLSLSILFSAGQPATASTATGAKDWTNFDLESRMVTNKEHARRRAQIEAERAERRRQEEEERARRNRKLKSRSIPAKWHWKGGIALGGVKIYGGMFYAGANMKDMVEPRLTEPSLLSPLYPVADSPEGAAPLESYPCYEYLSPEQRRGYIEFLASDRSETDDIGFVFLYFYGLERRLLLDTTKPGEVSEEERASIVAEMLRLVEVFGDRSRSLCHYIGMALLYDGSIFDILDAQGIRTLFDLDDLDRDRMKILDDTENASAMTYMLVSRLHTHKIEIPSVVLAAAAKGRLLRSPNVTMLGITHRDLYDSAFDKMLSERISAVKTEREAKPARRAIAPENPVLYPASVGLRRGHRFEVTGKVAKDPEQMGIPLRKLADIAVSCRKELDVFCDVESSSSKRGIDEVALDAVVASAPENCALETFLYGKKTAAYAPMKVFDEDLRRRLGCGLSYTAKGALTTSSQQMISVVSAAYGWQAMVPEAVDCPISSTWRITDADRIVMFKRGVGHDNRNGKRCLAPVFGGDSQSFRLIVPGSWNDACRLSYIFAWFVSRCPDSLSSKDLMRYSATYNPVWSSSGKVELQQLLFYSLRYATYSLSTSTHGIRQCLDAVEFSHVQDLVFSMVNDMFGNMIPHDVMAALEELYRKAGRDKAMVLYDYHAGTYHVVSDNAAGFSIDEDRLAETIADTSNVHSILNDAMRTGTADEIEIAESRVSGSSEAVVESVDEVEIEEETSSIEDGIALVKEAFGGTDEMATSELLAFISEKLGLSSSAEAMGWIAELNATTEVVEIDGAEAYLDI